MRSIRAKILWLLIGGIAAASLIIGTASVISSFGIIKSRAAENMNLLCKTNAEEIDIMFAKIEESVNILAHYAQSELTDVQALKDRSFRAEYSANIGENSLNHIKITEGAMAVWLYFDESMIGETDGFFYVKNEATGEFEKRSLTAISAADDSAYLGWWYTPAKNGKATWLDPYYDPDIKEQIISYAVPLYIEDKLIGIIGADISSQYIEKITKEISADNGKILAILASDGEIVYHPKFESGYIIQESDPDFKGVIDKLMKQERTDKIISYELDGISKNITGCKLRNGMLVVCFSSVTEIYGELFNSIFITFAVIAVVMLSVVMIGLFISERIAKPIKELNQAAQNLLDDDFDYKLEVNTSDEIGQLTATFIETRSILRRQMHLLRDEAHRDGLTGVGNKAAFMDKEAEINKEISVGTADFSIVVFDVNKLKIANDIFGHSIGDKLLFTVSEYLCKVFDSSNVYRIGGDEFVVILTGEQKSNCNELIDICTNGMKSLSIEDVPECKVSCACGLAHFRQKLDQQFSDVLRRADKEMYKNKALTKKDPFPWQEGGKGIKQFQIEKYCQLLKTLKFSTDDFLFLMNTETGVLHIFGQDTAAFGIADGRELSNGISDLLNYVYVNDHPRVEKALSSVVNYDVESIDINFRMIMDTVQWVNCRASMVVDENDARFVVIGRISQNAVKHLYNPITTLFNKTKLNLYLQSGAENRFSCLMLIDIDNLSEINLNHGSVYGDDLLKTLAEELEDRFSTWQIYHTEKDRFVVLLDVDSSKDVQKIFEEIKASLAGKCSISASVVPNDSSLYSGIENIYDYAVQILSDAKNQGIGQIGFFSKTCLLERISAVELLEELEESVKNKCEGFSLVYQPQIRADDFSVISAEALLRFDSKTNGQVYPDRFIPILEKTGLINEVGLWVVNKALAACKKWREFMPDFKISVNISPKQLEKMRIIAQITKILAEYKLPADALILEITESTQLDQNDEIFAVLAKLRQAGILIAVDDFGTGYSNLGNLKRIHANILKVDRVFIRDIKENGYNYNLIHNIIDFAKSNSLKVCLEGVENTSELIVVSGLNPDILQGYLFDKPCSADEFEAKYFISDSAEYAKVLEKNERLSKEKRHAPLVNIEMKTILRSINVGLWIIRMDNDTGEGELYADETMRKLLGVDDSITPEECFKHWHSNISKEHCTAVDKMIDEMAGSDDVVQAEYLWHHPQKGVITVRCSGRCIEKNDVSAVFEGFHRVTGNFSNIQ